MLKGKSQGQFRGDLRDTEGSCGPLIYLFARVTCSAVKYLRSPTTVNLRRRLLSSRRRQERDKPR